MTTSQWRVNGWRLGAGALAWIGGAGLVATNAEASQSVGAPAAAQFVAGECPTPPAPIAELKNARCGRLTVPENRAAPSSRTISLSVAIIPAKAATKQPDPIVWLAGGPGDDAITEIPWALGGELNSNRDVIFISQRGTFSAQPSTICPSVDRAGAVTLDMPYDSDEARKAVLEAQSACHQELLARGVDIAAYNSSESAADLEDARIALGYPKWNVYGISYGTDLTLTYMRLFPNGIRAAGIDGVFPPSTGGAASGWKGAEGIKAVFAACAQQRECRERYGDVEALFRRLVVQYERDPKTFMVAVPGQAEPVKVKVSGGMLVQWVASPGTHFAGQVPAALHELANGRSDRITKLWATARLDPNGVGVVGQGLFNTISCSEWVPYETEAEVAAAGAGFFPEFPRSALLNAPNNQFLHDICSVWPVPRASPSVRDVVRSEIPTLIVNSQYDAQTAPSNGALVAQTLPNAVVVTIPNVAHVAFASPSPDANACAQKIVRSFFDNPAKPDTSCIASVPPTKFVIVP
jgi:pimeloyl-ACP methyl ester carboxylesterase